VAGRALTFTDAQVIQLATKQCIPVASDDWYNRRKRDAEGEFFRMVSSQGPRGNNAIDGPSRQGMYIFTAVHEDNDRAVTFASDRLSKQYSQDFSKLVHKYALAGDPQSCRSIHESSGASVRLWP